MTATYQSGAEKLAACLVIVIASTVDNRLPLLLAVQFPLPAYGQYYMLRVLRSAKRLHRPEYKK